VSKRWIPDLGDLIHLDFDPQAGHEQAGRRPAIVLSESAYNGTGMALLCPITSQVKGYPFEVSLPTGMSISGVILSDQIRCVDLRERKAKPMGAAAPKGVIEAVQLRLKLILNLK